jgi:hypothetical protein
MKKERWALHATPKLEFISSPLQESHIQTVVIWLKRLGIHLESVVEALTTRESLMYLD